MNQAKWLDCFNSKGSFYCFLGGKMLVNKLNVYNMPMERIYIQVQV